LIEHVAVREVRAEIAQGVTVISFEAFCRSEAPMIRAKYGVEPVELGIPFSDDQTTEGMVN
jgi:hypothetical protein